MSRLQPSTDRMSPKTRGYVYREAARRMEANSPPKRFDCPYQYSCCAIMAVHDDEHMAQRLADEYVAVFTPEPSGPLDDYGTSTRLQYAYLECGGDARNVRILALCFMAAMVEAGDA